MSSTLFGMRIVLSAVHPLKELLLINLSPFGRTISVKVSHPVNALLPIFTTVSGITTVFPFAAVGGQYTISLTVAS